MVLPKIHIWEHIFHSSTTFSFRLACGRSTGITLFSLRPYRVKKKLNWVAAPKMLHTVMHNFPDCPNRLELAQYVFCPLANTIGTHNFYLVAGGTRTTENIRFYPQRSEIMGKVQNVYIHFLRLLYLPRYQFIKKYPGTSGFHRVILFCLCIVVCFVCVLINTCIWRKGTSCKNRVVQTSRAVHE